MSLGLAAPQLRILAMLVLAVGCASDLGGGDEDTTTTSTDATTASASSGSDAGAQGSSSSTDPDTSEASSDSAGSSTGSTVACDEARAQLEAVAAAYSRAESLVGLAVSVATEGCEPWSFAWGSADVATDAALTTAHVLRAGSVTKSYTAAVMLRLAEEDLLTLDDSLEEWGIEVPDAAAITVRALLNHTSGLADYQNHDGFRQALQADPDRVWAPQELVDFAIELGPVGARGATHAYSNTNYVLAAMLGELATGETYAQAVRSRALAPNGLEHTYLEGTETWDDPTATGYLVVSNGVPQDSTGYYHASQAWSAGAMVSTADDLRAWMTALLASDYLDPESQAALVELVPDMVTNGYGLGIFVLESGDVTAFGHNGAVVGFQAAAFYDPGTGTSVAVMHNQITLDAAGNLAADPTALAMEILMSAAGPTE